MDELNFERIAKALRFLDDHWTEQPRLARVASHAGLSEFHFNRLFRRWAGITPRQYLSHLTAQAAHGAIGAERSMLEAALSIGLSGPGRLHDLMVTIDALTPGEIRSGGEGVVLRAGTADSPFGRLFAAISVRGIARLEFVGASEAAALVRLRSEWPRARIEQDDAAVDTLAARLWSPASARAGAGGGAPLRLAVRGTNFELKVWRALLALDCPTTTYGDLAGSIGEPRSARAVGNAIGASPVAVLIPCHRVLRANGALGGYRWGTDRKRALLAWEALGQVHAHA